MFKVFDYCLYESQSGGQTLWKNYWPHLICLVIYAYISYLYFFISYSPHLLYIPHLIYIVTSWRQSNAPILLITTMALWWHAGYGRPVPHLICLFTSFLLALDFACSKIKCLSFCLSCLLSNNYWATWHQISIFIQPS